MLSNFISALIGAIVGGIVSYIGSKKIFKAQLDIENSKLLEMNEQKKRTIEASISLGLKNEMQYDIGLLQNIKVQEYAEEFVRGGKSQYYLCTKQPLEFKIYETLLMSMAEYKTDEVISEIEKIYTTFYLFKNQQRILINELPQNQIADLSTIETRVSKLIDKLKAWQIQDK